MDKIAELHDSINNIDKQIVRLLAERKDLICCPRSSTT